MAESKLRERALKVWADNLKKGHVLRTAADIPDPVSRAILKRERLMFPVRRGFFILKKPEDEPQQLFLLLYWQIIEKTLERYKPWSIRAESALKLLIGNEEDQKHLLARTGRTTNKTLTLPFGFRISLVSDKGFDSRTTKEIKVAGRNLVVDVPEKVLIDAVSYRQRIPADYSIFIKSVQFNPRLIEALYAKRPRPVILKRITGLAAENGRQNLVSELERITKTYTPYAISRRERKPQAAVKPGKKLASPWVSRQEELIKTFEKQLSAALMPSINQLPKHKLGDLIKNAQEHKRYDIYHSTTLEGYRITPEEVDAVVFGKVPTDIKNKEKHIEQIKNRMAILGYSEAFDSVISQVNKDFDKGHVSEQLVKDTYYHLFKPSADSGIIDYFDLVSYRKEAAFIRGTRYVPPAPEKLTDQMGSFERSINKVKNDIIKAILTHYFFVTIHPYTDGNGRTARLLMNYLLLTSGYQWITIRAEQRKPYFDALAEGQLHDDIVPFGEFIVSLMKEPSEPS